MGIIRKLKDLRSSAPTTSGARAAAEGRSDLSDLAGKLDDIRGDNVSIGGDPATSPTEDKMAKLVEDAKTIRTVNAPGEGKLLGE